MNPLQITRKSFTAKRIYPLLLLLLISTGASAQAVGAAAPAPAADASLNLAQQLIWLLYILAAIVVMLVFATLVLIDYLYKAQVGRSIFPSLSIPALQWSWWTGSKPASAKVAPTFDQDLGHDYDGISELDNPAPPLFNYILYGTVLFALIYLVNYHVLGWGETQEQEYLASSNELDTLRARATRLAANKVDEGSVKLMTDVGTLAAGKATYEQYCATCHLSNGAGKIGPNLADDYWLHGNAIQDIFKTIKYGVPAKGMIAWQAQLSPAQMAEVASYLTTFYGTNPPDGKGPEGVKLGAPTGGAAPVSPADSSAAAPAQAATTMSMVQPR